MRWLLEGERLFRRSRRLWATSYFVVLVAFVITVVPWEGNWTLLGSSLWIWIGGVATFAVVCIAVYLYFRFWSPFRETEQEESEPVEIGSVR
jgi:Ca2+/Na+ antiporter